jgi:hypothetical protein
MFVPPAGLIESATFYNESIRQDQPALLVTILAGRYSKAEDLKFTYNITSYTARSLTIQLNFYHPILISSW